MLKDEFEKLAGVDLPYGDWEVVNLVYTFHPSISEVNGKQQVAELYKNCGMQIFCDMRATAEQVKDIEEKIREHEGTAKILRETIERMRQRSRPAK